MKTIFQLTCYICLLPVFISCEKETETKYLTQTLIEEPPAANSKMHFSSDPLVFVKGETVQKKVVITSSDSALEYSVLQAPDWVVYHNPRGVIKGLHDFNVRIDTFSSFPFGISRDSIEFYTIYGRNYLEVQFVNGEGEQIVLEDTIEIGEISNQSDFTFFNRTQDSISYSLTSSPELTLSASSGVIESFKTKKVIVNVDRSQLTQDTTYFTVDLNYKNMNKSVVVRVLSFFEDKVKLNGNVIDAEFEENNKVLYYLNNNPNQLVKFDPVTEQFQSLSLSYTPICLSLSSSGSYAAIGNDGNATLVDLNNFSVINSFTTGTLPSDIIIKDSAFVYVFPEVGSHVRVKCIDLQNNYSITQSTGWTISDQSKAVLHPTQDAIYVADNGVFPSDIQKLDVSNGTASLLYDSPYHGDYYMGGDLWITKDGSRLITRGKTVLQTTTNQSTDLIYSGSVQLNIPQELTNGRPSNYFVIQSLDEDALNDKLVLAAVDDAFSPTVIDQVYLHQASTLQYLKRFDLESFVVPNHASGKYDFYRAEPFFTCFTGYGNEILVITKGTGSGLSNPWGMELFN